MDKICFIFPAFGIDYSDLNLESLNTLIELFKEYILKASKIINIKHNDNLIHLNEIELQYYTYIYSAAVSDYLESKNITPKYVSGYSMGIYAAFYSTKSISFEDGLQLIKNAYYFALNHLDDSQYRMGAIIGLNHDDVKKIINENIFKIEIVNINNEFSYTLSGIKEDIEKALNIAQDEGALSVKLLNINTPYHSSFIKESSSDFKKYLDTIKINKPVYEYVSTIDQSVIKTGDEVKLEIFKNLFSVLNWENTMNKIIELEVNTFFECGLGKSLYKNGRFINGNFKIYTLNKIDKYLKKRV